MLLIFLCLEGGFGSELGHNRSSSLFVALLEDSGHALEGGRHANLPSGHLGNVDWNLYLLSTALLHAQIFVVLRAGFGVFGIFVHAREIGGLTYCIGRAVACMKRWLIEWLFLKTFLAFLAFYT